MRRSELLGLRWTDLDADLARLSINRGLVAVGYELHESRGKTDHSRRCIDLDDTTLSVLAGWRALQAAECAAVGVNNPGWMFTTAVGAPMHLHAISQTFERIVRRTAIPVIRLHDLRHTHGSLLIAAGVPAKVVAERLGHVWFACTVETYSMYSPACRPTPHESSKHSSRHVPRPTRASESRLNTRENDRGIR